MALSDAQMAQFMQAAQAEAREQILYQFNCGLMTMKGKLVSPDTRKGKVVLSMEDDGLLRFQWRLRHKDENELQFFIFPDGATWSRVNECKDGVVFLLKMRDTDVKHFFWSQESRGSGNGNGNAAEEEKKAVKKDQEILRRISSLIKDPPKFGAPLPKEEELQDADDTMTDVPSMNVISSGGVSLVQGMDHPTASPVQEAHRGVHTHPASGVVAGQSNAPATASSTGASTSTSAPTGGSIDSASLMSTLHEMALQLQARQSAQSQAGVEDVLDSDRVQQILDVDSALVNALVEYLPEGQRSPEALRAQLRSPQLQQTMSRLTQILNSSQFGQLMASLSLPVGPNTGLGVEAFIAAIQTQANKQQQEKKQ